MKVIAYNCYVQSIIKVTDSMNSHLDESIDIITMARIDRFSASHFGLIFKAIKGESPVAFMTRLRMEAAAQLLRYSSHMLTKLLFCCK